MTDPMELVGRLEAAKRSTMMGGETCFMSVDLVTEVAACIREMVEARNGGHVSEAPDDQGFVPWSGGHNPCPGRRVDAVWLGEVHHDRSSDDLDWAHNDICDHITSYRVLPPAPGAEA